jgi:hypothetical protein
MEAWRWREAHKWPERYVEAVPNTGDLATKEKPARCPSCGTAMIRLGPVPAYLWPARPPDSS